MRAVVRSALIGLLVGTLAYGLSAAISLMTKTWGCLGANPRVGSATSLPPPCPSVRLHLLGPGRQDVILALLCAVAAIAAVVTVQPGTRTESKQRIQRYARQLEPFVVIGILVVLAPHVAPGIQGFGDGLATGVLFFLAWLSARQVVGLWLKLGATPEEGWAGGVPALHRLTFQILLGLVLALSTGAVVAYFANQHDMHHVHAGTVLLSTSIYALGAVALLLLAQYTSLRSKSGGQRAVGGRHMRVRWLTSCTLLVAGLLLVAMVAPTASESTTSLGKNIMSALLGSTPRIGSDQHSCRTDRRYCGRLSRRVSGTLVKKKPAPHKLARHSIGARSNWIVAIGRLAFWLIPLVPLVYFLRSRQQQLGRGGIGLLLFLQAVWRRGRSRSARLRAMIEARLPSSLVEVGASAAIARRAGRSLSTREQIVQYYLNAVRYAEQHGITHPPAQTPEEFEHVVSRRLGTNHEAWKTLTADFIEARFSLHAPSGEQPAQAESAWRAARAAIRHAARAPSRLRPR